MSAWTRHGMDFHIRQWFQIGSRKFRAQDVLRFLVVYAGSMLTSVAVCAG